MFLVAVLGLGCLLLLDLDELLHLVVAVGTLLCAEPLAHQEHSLAFHEPVAASLALLAPQLATENVLLLIASQAFRFAEVLARDPASFTGVFRK